MVRQPLANCRRNTTASSVQELAEGVLLICEEK